MSETDNTVCEQNVQVLQDTDNVSLMSTIKEIIDSEIPGITDGMFASEEAKATMLEPNAIQRSFIKEWLTPTIVKWNKSHEDARATMDARLVLVSDELPDNQYVEHFKSTVMPVLITTCRRIMASNKQAQEKAKQTSV